MHALLKLFILAFWVQLICSNVSAVDVLAESYELEEIEEPGEIDENALEFDFEPIRVSEPTVLNTGRSLQGVVFDEPTYIPLGTVQADGGNFQRAYQFILTKMNDQKSQFLLYPYPFTKTFANDTVSEFPQGAVISTKNKDFPEASAEAYFKNIHDTTNLTLSRSKAMYDISIAILQIEGPFDGKEKRDLMSEAFSYCSPLHTYTGNFLSCFTSDDYRTYIKNTPDHERTSIVYLTEEDIKTGFLFSGSSLRFGMLIIPDIYTGSQDVIYSLLGSTGSSQIRSFASKGGLVFSSGKGALIVEKVGLVTAGTFDSNSVLAAQSSTAATKGCDMASMPSTFDNTAWITRSLCFSLSTSTYGVPWDSLLSAPRVKALNGLKSASEYDRSKWKLLIKDPMTGLSRTATDDDGPFYHVLFREYGKGRVIVHLGNPVLRSRDFQWLFNAVFLAQSRPMILDTNVAGDWDNVPALEQLSMSISLTPVNVYNYDLTNVAYRLWMPLGTLLLDPVPSGCTLVKPAATPPSTDYNTTFHIDCTPPGQIITKFARYEHTFIVYINDVLITRQQFKIPMLYPIITYTDTSRNNLIVTLDYGAVTIDAYMAALIRADINPDPVGHYPVKGSGNYIDSVVWAENKEETVAKNVSLNLIVPIVTPITDGSNQGQLLELYDLDYLYYQKATNGMDDYVYPMKTYKTNPRDHDYLDYRLLAKRKNILVADWDTPVKLFKEVRSTAFPSMSQQNISDVHNAGYNTNIDNDDTVTKEVYFPDSDNFYEHAAQRMLATLDLNTPEGFDLYDVPTSWTGGTCPAWMKNSKNDALRYNLQFGRNDMYFYETVQNIPLPAGVTSSQTTFSGDRYNPLFTGSCESTFGNARAQKLVKGYFDHTKTTGADIPAGLKPNEYSNELLMNCDKNAQRVDPFDTAALESATGGKVKLTHYVYRLEDNPGIATGDDVMYFRKDTTVTDDEWYYAPATVTGESRFGDYPEVRMLYLYGTDFTLAPDISRKGGRLTIKLASGVNWKAGTDPVSLDAITFGADQVVILSTKYDSATRTITTEFRRGNMPNENYGKDSQMTMHLEYLDYTSSQFTATIELEELVHIFHDDYKYQGDPYTRYDPQPGYTKTLTFNRMLCLHLPALSLEFTLRRGDSQTESFIQPYEYLEPFVRTGNFMQELKARQTIWGKDEVHHVSDPGLIGKSGGFMWISNIGINSIPFREYLTTGSKQVIPSAAYNAHISWVDIWDRFWAQPIRSVFVDVPPIPPPIRNFIMTTTFELIDSTSLKRVMEWRSEDDVIVHVQMKLLNNYPKWFEITNCKENTLAMLPGEGPAPSRVFWPDAQTNLVTDMADKNQWISLGHDSRYGQCFKDPEVWLNGTLMTAQQRAWIANASYCSDSETFYEGCEHLKGLPTVTKRKDSSTGTWNYADQVNTHWTPNYVKDNMWDMTHYDYDDTPFDKAYKYHMDNNLPNMDIGIIRPHNIIAFPIFKGLGYEMDYSKTLSVNHACCTGKKGWWSDNLQNRDHTVMVGQSLSNDVAVGKSDLTQELGWVKYTDLAHAPTSKVNKVLGNIYACEFNRHRVKVDPTNVRNTYPKNVYQNNIVPIDPTLDKHDPRLTSYDCSSPTQYTPDTISQFDNYLATQTPRDWLYFAANLRGNAKETINVLYTLKPNAKAKREGITKVQDGGRFVYWNPCCGPNAYLIVDNPVSTVIAKRTDLELAHDILPTVAPTFGANVLQWIQLSDPEEVNREWTMPIYINHFGYGDAAVSTYVGGYAGSGCVLQPGDTTYIKIEFFNNAGFDWSLYTDGITSVDVESKPWNAMDLLSRQKHAIQAPIAFNFMNLDIPAELEPYIDIKPSNHNIDTAPLFFDFENINVATIRDGFKAQYYYMMKISKSLPATLRGRLYEIQLSLNESYFDMLPGYNDPTNLKSHDYKLEIPPMVFGFPYDNSAASVEWVGKIFYTSGYATNLVLQHLVDKQFTVMDARYVTEPDVNRARVVASDPIGRQTNLEYYWGNLTKPGGDHCCAMQLPIISQNIIGNWRYVYYNLSVVADKFPYPKPAVEGPDEAQSQILVHTYAEQLKIGWNYGSYRLKVTYKDFMAKTKSYQFPTPLRVRATGAWITVSYLGQLLNDEFVILSQQRLQWDDHGICKAIITARNSGTDIAYNVELSVFISNDITVLTDKIDGAYTLVKDDTWDAQRLTIPILEFLPNGGSAAKIVYFRYSGLPETSKDATSRTFIKGAEGQLDLTSTKYERRVTETIDKAYNVALYTGPVNTAILTGTRDSQPPSSIFLKVTTQYIDDLEGIEYVFYRRSTGEADWTQITNQTASTYLDKDPLVGLLDANPNAHPEYKVQLMRRPYMVAESNIWVDPYEEGFSFLALGLGCGAAAAFLGAFLYMRRKPEEKYVRSEDPSKPGVPIRAKKKTEIKQPFLEEEERTEGGAPMGQYMKLGRFFRGGGGGKGRLSVMWGKLGHEDIESAPREIDYERGDNGKIYDPEEAAAADRGIGKGGSTGTQQGSVKWYLVRLKDKLLALLRSCLACFACLKCWGRKQRGPNVQRARREFEMNSAPVSQPQYGQPSGPGKASPVGSAGKPTRQAPPPPVVRTTSPRRALPPAPSVADDLTSTEPIAPRKFTSPVPNAPARI